MDVLPGIVDEAALGIDYETLDRILDGLERGLDPARVAATRAGSDAQVRDVQGVVRRSQRRWELPPWPDVGEARLR